MQDHFVLLLVVSIERIVSVDRRDLPADMIGLDQVVQFEIGIVDLLEDFFQGACNFGHCLVQFLV